MAVVGGEPRPAARTRGRRPRRGLRRARRMKIDVALRVLVILCFFAAWWATYAWTNARGADPSRAVYLTPPRDLIPGILQPWTAVVYLAGGLALPVLPFFYYREWPRL